MMQALKAQLVSAVAFCLSPDSRYLRAETAPEPERPQIEVHIYNDIGVPDGDVSGAKQVASRVFRQAGIDLGWSDCTVKRSSSGRASSPCESPGPAGILVYFVGPLEEHFKWVDQNALGYSIIPEAKPGTMAYISYPRIKNLSDSTSAGVPDLLGLAVAHEIGHLLFGSHSHANQGIMRAPWRLHDLQGKAWNEFEFTGDQASRLRVAVQTRLQPAIREIKSRNTTD